VSPILIRPVREQLEHDRVIRLLHTRLRRRFEIAVNLGPDQATPVRAGRAVLYPDLVLTAPGRSRKLAGIVEVETGESVNHLEAMAQWAHFSRVHVPFSLYVPAASVEMARRLCADHEVVTAEIWSYHIVGGQVRFTLVHRAPAPRSAARARAARARARKPARRAPARAGKRRTKARPSGRAKKRK
jgi:hypothetical protein